MYNIEFLKGRPEKKNYFLKLINGLIPRCHLLFYGPPGTGKTSSAVALAKDLLGENLSGNFLELNASNERGIQTIRGPVIDFSRAIPRGAKYKILLLDESDYLTPDAQAALRRTMEKWGHNVMFILTANQINKIKPAVRSRCSEIYFNRLNAENTAKILRAGGVSMPLSHVSQCQGDYRKILQIIKGQKICNGMTYKKFVGLVFSKNSKEIKPETLKSFFQMGSNFQALALEILEQLKNLKVSIEQKLKIYSIVANYEWRIIRGSTTEIQTLWLIAEIKGIL